jgi:pyruvate/2-oxoglutarate dehydrogenase complex dihydrolipoamide dehydrogenase (E3) component
MPNLDTLNLGATNIKLNKPDNTIWVDEYSNTSVKGVYAVGDVIR